MFKFKKMINESTAIKIFRKHNLIILPGELKEIGKPLEEVEGEFPSYHKMIHINRKNLQICKYEDVIDSNERQIPFMVILEYRSRSFIYQSRRCAVTC